MSSARATRPVRARRSRLLFVVVMLATTLPVCELLLRVLPVNAFALDALQLDPRLARYDPHPYLAYALKPDWSHSWGDREVSHNSLGFRGAEFERTKAEGVVRIVCIGGSSTYGQGPSSDARTWPARLEVLLNERSEAPRVEVINAGAPGYTSYESLMNLALRVIELQPDLVLVYHGFNDQRFWFRRDVQPDNSHARAVWPVSAKSSLEAWLEHSRLFLVARRYLTDFGERRRLAWWTVKGFGEASTRTRTMDASGPGYFARNLEHMLALCRSRGIQLAFGLQAYYRDDVRIAAEHDGLSAAHAAVRGVAERHAAPLLDLDAALPQERELFVDAVHLSDAGAELLAQRWAEFLVSHALVRPRD